MVPPLASLRLGDCLLARTGHAFRRGGGGGGLEILDLLCSGGAVKNLPTPK